MSTDHIKAAVIEEMQSAEEMGGVADTAEYIELMLSIAKEAIERADTASSIFREVEVSAELVATAPELLALAVRCKEYLRHADGHHLPAGEWLKLNEDLSAVIAKAGGRS